MKRKIVPITLASLLLGLLFDLLFYGKIPGISVFIYSLILLGCTFYLSTLFKSSLPQEVYGLMVPILFFSFMIFVRANPFIVVMNIFLVLYLLFLSLRLAWRPDKKLRDYKVIQYLQRTATVPLRTIGEFFITFRRAFETRGTVPKSSSRMSVVRGIFISLPILFILFLLLSSADAVFKQFADSIFDISLSGETIFRWGLIALLSCLYIGAYGRMFIQTMSSEPRTKDETQSFGLGSIESSIVLGSVSFLFFIFVIVQFAYFFGGANHFAATGYTYAEYARKGFFELIAVAFISLILIWMVKTFFRPQKGKRADTLQKSLSAVLVAEVMIIMLSAHIRLNLYEQAYGFTSMRLLSHMFIGWLAVALLLALGYVVTKEKESQFAFQIFASILIFFALFNLVNPDAFIARQNINRYGATGRLDVYYLSNLSVDASPQIASLLKHPDPAVQNAAANILYRQEKAVDSEGIHWQSANLAKWRANKIFANNLVQIEMGKNFNDYSSFEPK